MFSLEFRCVWGVRNFEAWTICQPPDSHIGIGCNSLVLVLGASLNPLALGLWSYDPKESPCGLSTLAKTKYLEYREVPLTCHKGMG